MRLEHIDRSTSTWEWAMLPLARLWTWTGQAFVPAAIVWAVHIQKGLVTDPPPEGVLISQAYAGLIVTLIAGIVLMWCFALYARAARQRRATMLVPPNTMFEDKDERNAVVSWGTAVVFASAVLVALIVFGSAYSKSHIHVWESKQPLQPGFLSSSATAHHQSCPRQPCFALASQYDPKDGQRIDGVFEYIRFVTDGGLVALALVFFSGLVQVTRSLQDKPDAQHEREAVQANAEGPMP
jgi:hypothetical protein